MRDALLLLVFVVYSTLLPAVAAAQGVQPDALPPFAPPSPLRFERLSLAACRREGLWDSAGM